MLKYHIINLASCRLCPRRAAGGKERRYMDQNDKNKSNKNNDRRKGVLSLLIWALVLTIGFNYLLSAMDTRKLAESTCEIRYDEFLDLVRDGKVKEVEIADRTLNITPVDGFTYTDADGKTYSGDFQLFTTQINDPELRSFLDENGVEFGKPYKAETSYLEIIMLNYVLPTALMVGAFILMMRFISKKTGGGGFGGLGSVGKSNAKVYMEKSTGVTFADVAGQDEAKESLVEIIDFLHNPQKYTDIGAKLPRGALLVGPPGTGKTLLAKAVAGEANVPFFSISGSDFVEMFVGVGASRVRDLFQQAAKVAPAIIFIDEIDAIGRTRDSKFGGNDEREQTLNQLLAEIDGFDSSKGVVILAATNRPEILDKALLRAGRFDRRIIVDRPNLAGRYQTLRVHTKNIKLAEDVDLHKIAQATAGAVGADLANLVNEAALRAVRLGRKAVNQQDLLTSFELVIAGTEKKGTVLTDTEKRIVSYHEVGHALVAALQKHSQPVSKITIVPHTSGALGYTMQMPEEEKFLSSREELIVELQTMLGGRAAEQIVFGIATTGASNDIERATELARKMVTQYGMSDKLGLMALSTVSNPYLDGSTMMNCADSTSSAADEEIHKLLMDCYEDAKRLLTEHRALLDEIAMYLLTKETITGDEFMTYVNAENKKLTDGSEPAQDEQDAEAPASPDAPQEDAPSTSD